MTRPIEERRRLLKTLVASSAAFVALPDTWKKPIVESVILPVHAQASGPSVPPFISTVSFAYTVSGPQGISGTLTPSNSPETHIFSDSSLASHNYQIDPTVVVDPSITDTFNLSVNEVVSGGDDTNFTPASQTLAPDPVNGAIPFLPINASVDNAMFLTYQITLTPSNPAFSTFFLEITFDEAPPGP